VRLRSDGADHDRQPCLRGHEVRFLTAQRPGGVENAAPITIGDGVWLGARCTILARRCWRGNYRGAGVTVTTDVPPNTLMTGAKPSRWPSGDDLRGQSSGSLDLNVGDFQTMIDRTVAMEIVLSALRDAVDQNGGDASAITDETVIVGPVRHRLDRRRVVGRGHRTAARNGARGLVTLANDAQCPSAAARSYPAVLTDHILTECEAAPCERTAQTVSERRHAHHGNAQGIGRHLAETYARRGYHVEGCSRGEPPSSRRHTTRRWTSVTRNR